MNPYARRVSRFTITYLGLTSVAALHAVTPPVGVRTTPAFVAARVGATVHLKVAVANTTNTKVRWMVNDIPGGNTAIGTIDDAGLYKAPAKRPPLPVVRVKAVSMVDPAATDTTVVSIRDLGVTVTPSRARLRVGETQAFVARVEGSSNQQVRWLVNDVAGGNASLGTITTAGLYKAPAREQSSVIRVKAVSVADPEAFDQTRVVVQALIVTMLPDRPTLKMGGTLKFTAKVDGASNQQVRWFINGIAGGNATTGLINANGQYSTPAKQPSPATLRVKAVSMANPNAFDTTVLRIENLRVSVSPDRASLKAGAKQQFTAQVAGSTNQQVRWLVNDVPSGNATLGTIGTGGMYTAPAKRPSPAAVRVKAISAVDPEAMDSLPVTIDDAAGVKVTVTPESGSLDPGGMLQFTVTVDNSGNKEVKWFVNDIAGGNVAVGSIGATGLYKAPPKTPKPAAVRIKAVSAADAQASDTSVVSIKSAAAVQITLTPGTVKLKTAATQQFQAVVENATNKELKWYVNNVVGGDDTNGKVSIAGLYTAPAKVPSPAVVTVKAVSVADPTATATATVTVGATTPITVTLLPETVPVAVGLTQQFTATVTNTTTTGVKWFVNNLEGGNATLGTISATGLYKAPPAPPSPATITIKALSMASADASDTSVVTVQAPGTGAGPVSPSVIPPGAFTLTVTGTGFVPSTTATFAGAAATVTLVSPTEVRVTGTTPAGKLGDMVLVVINPSPSPATRPYLVEVRSDTGDPKVSLADAHRQLRQATFGPSPESLDRLQAIGHDAWLTEQLAAVQPDAYPAALDTEGSLEPLQERFMRLTVSWPDQLRLKAAWILSQIFVVSGVEVSRSEAMVSYQRMLYDNALGNFATVLRTVALHPAMGEYLDNVNNGKADLAAGKVPNENFGRESLQLLTVGVQKLQLNGSQILGADGLPTSTYDQNVVIALTRALTGWTYNNGVTGQPTSWQGPNYNGLMEAVERFHDTGEKILMDECRIPPSQTAEQDLTSALNHLFTHPNVGPFIGRQFIQHLVTSNPSPDYIARVAARFNDNGSGVRGDLKALLRAVLTDQEAAGGGANFGHLREPVAFIAAQLRPLRPTISNYPFTTDLVGEMAQPVFYSPSVFNYYSPNFRPAGSALFRHEFQLYNTATAIIRANFTSDLVQEGFYGSLQLDLSNLTAAATDPGLLVDLIDRSIMGRPMSPGMKSAITTAVTQLPVTNPKLRVRLALYLTYASPQFQVEH